MNLSLIILRLITLLLPIPVLIPMKSFLTMDLFQKIRIFLLGILTAFPTENFLKNTSAKGMYIPMIRIIRILNLHLLKREKLLVQMVKLSFAVETVVDPITLWPCMIHFPEIIMLMFGFAGNRLSGFVGMELQWKFPM